MCHIINLEEWQTVILEGEELSDNYAREAAKILTENGIVEILELKDGLKIATNSYVGKIILGDTELNISPKINGLPLYQLLRYAYGFKKIKLFNKANHSIENLQFFDLLIYELFIEVNDLLRSGIQKSYILQEEDLTSPRGKINTNKLCFQGGIIKDKLPCKYFFRDEDNNLNRVLLSGLKLSLNLVSDTKLKFMIQKLCFVLEKSIKSVILNRVTLQNTRKSLNRLNERYSAALEIINILYESQGIQLENSNNNVQLKGYYFDMNAFFETLVGRILLDCMDKYSIKEQYNLHEMFLYTPEYNPCRRKSPTPRPDFAIMKNGIVVKLLDAKYRDLWERTLPREMLYQLAIYAVSGIGNKTATILFPSVTDIPTVQKIDISNPVSGAKLANVILIPLNLIKVADLISKDLNDLKEYINEIIS